MIDKMFTTQAIENKQVSPDTTGLFAPLDGYCVFGGRIRLKTPFSLVAPSGANPVFCAGE
jgi:hypothetical protein